MTHTHATTDVSENRSSSWVLPAVGSCLLTLAWALYVGPVVFGIFATLG